MNNEALFWIAVIMIYGLVCGLVVLIYYSYNYKGNRDLPTKKEWRNHKRRG